MSATRLEQVREVETDAVVVRREEIAEGVVSLVLTGAAGIDLPMWTPGAHVDLVLGNGLTRQYSLCGDPDAEALWRIGVLREPASPGRLRVRPCGAERGSARACPRSAQ